ncbi:hypothetical protein EDB89DRAFT_26273 [Lactarius sanguifluus]|nr:hypothetical protein EDB89DRAFT_26273 [Lactarius sanguifluus]
MATTQPPPGNLKDRIAALQQRNGTPSPTSSPTPPSRDASVTPPRGSLRDKIAKFERKGGVPIPRGSFAMGVPPPEDAGSTKSRELYGNRVAALGKGRPTAPGNSGNSLQRLSYLTLPPTPFLHPRLPSTVLYLAPLIGRTRCNRTPQSIQIVLRRVLHNETPPLSLVHFPRQIPGLRTPSYQLRSL